MKTKFLLPVLAMIFAIGLSFANIERASDPTTDYYLENGQFEPIGMELNCGTGNIDCEVEFEEDGTTYKVYDAQSTNSLKKGNGQVIELWR